MNQSGIRISGPHENIALRVEDLVLLMHGIQKERGNIWCSIYSTDKQQYVPLLLSGIGVTGTVRFNAQVGTVVEEMQFDLLEQNADLRRQLAEAQEQLSAVPVDAMLECIGPDDYDFTAPTLTVLQFASWLEAQRSARR